MQFMNNIGWLIAAIVAHDLMAVIVYDVWAWFAKRPTISAMIRESHMAWPVAIMAALVVGTVIAGHFVAVNLPGK